MLALGLQWALVEMSDPKQTFAEVPRKHIGYGPRPIFVDVRAVWLTFAIGVAVLLAWAMRDLFVPFAFSAAFVLIGAPVVDAMKSHGMPRPVGAAIFLLVLGAVLTALTLLILPKLIDQIGDVVQRVPVLLEELEKWISRNFGVDDSLLRIREAVQERIDDIGGTLATGGVGGALGAGARGILRGAASFAVAAGLFLMVPVLVFFALSELDLLRRNVPRFIPMTWREPAARYGGAIRYAIFYMLRGQLMVAFCLMVIYMIGLSLAGVPFAMAISVIAGLGYFIPYATGTLLFVLSVLFTLLDPSASLLTSVIGAGVTALVGQAVETWFLTPRVVGKSAGLPPLLVVLAVLIGGELFGFVGILFSLPIATALAAVVRASGEIPYEEGDDDEHAG